MTATQPITQLSTIEVRNPADGTIVGEVPTIRLRPSPPRPANCGCSSPSGSPRPEGPQTLADEVPGVDPRQRRTHHGRRAVRDRQAAGRGVNEAPMTADILKYWAHNAEAFLADSHPKPHSPLG